MNLPKISIVIPSYNQGNFIEDTLCSVLDQNYPALELIVIDGGSTDATLEILKRYEDKLAYVVSEPDRGQTHAINKGLEKITGELWSYLNSDDLLLPGSLKTIADVYKATSAPWIAGISEMFDENGGRGYIRPIMPDSKFNYLAPWNRNGNYFLPCSNVSFMSKEVISKIGLFDESLHFSMDIEYYIRAIFEAGYVPCFVDNLLGKWRWHNESKTMTKGLTYAFRQDEITIAELYKKYLPSSEQKFLQKEIIDQKKSVFLRKLSFEYSQGIPLHHLIKGVVKHPRLLGFRPWYGSIRRSLWRGIF